jgi:hypothetical protein
MRIMVAKLVDVVTLSSWATKGVLSSHTRIVIPVVIGSLLRILFVLLSEKSMWRILIGIIVI